MLGNRWKGNLRGGLLLKTHTHTHTQTIPEAQVGALNTISVVSSGLVPYTARNSSLPTLYTPFPLLIHRQMPVPNPFFFPLVAGSLILIHFFFTVYPSLHHISSSTICSFSTSLPLSFFVLYQLLLPLLRFSLHLSPSDTLSVPAYGLGSLSNDEGGVSGVVHTLVGENDWVVHTWLLQSDSRRARLTVWWTL